jgi:hypothetical protein
LRHRVRDIGLKQVLVTGDWLVRFQTGSETK